MRKVMLFSIGFTISCIISTYFLHGLWLLIPALICIAGATVLFFLKSRPAKIAIVILLGVLAGLLWNWGYDGLFLTDARQYVSKVVQNQIEIIDYHSDTDYGVSADGRITL